jgi:ATP-dependent DNA helicase RecQ
VDLGRLIRFNKEREMTVADVKRFVGHLRARREHEGATDGSVAIGHGELGERERVLLSIAERAGAVELEPGGRDGLLVTPTGRGSPREAWAAIKAAKDRGWESYRSIERYSADGSTCRRRQILDHFGDDGEGAPSVRCCDVCEADAELVGAARAATISAGCARGARGSRTAAADADGHGLAPEVEVDAREFNSLRAWRLQRAEGKPAYTVATDAALRGVLHERPRSTRELLAVRGIGPAFCEKHGESLLEELAALASGAAPT